MRAERCAGKSLSNTRLRGPRGGMSHLSSLSPVSERTPGEMSHLSSLKHVSEKTPRGDVSSLISHHVMRTDSANHIRASIS